jgi:hypothetical protein
MCNGYTESTPDSNGCQTGSDGASLHACVPLGLHRQSSHRSEWTWQTSMVLGCSRGKRRDLTGGGGAVRCPSCSQSQHDEKEWKGIHVGPVLPEQRRGWSLMTFCARATRGRGRPSPGVMARLGVPVDGRVRKLRAVEDQSAPILEEITSELGRIIGSFVRRAHLRID